jgi:hypothetical protein
MKIYRMFYLQAGSVKIFIDAIIRRTLFTQVKQEKIILLKFLLISH